MNLSAIPNLITLLRLLLVVPVAVAILDGRFGLCLAFFTAASISDGVDGFLARRFDWTSRFGAILDPIVDKLLLVVVFVLLTYTGFIPLWLAAIVILRDLIVLTGATSYHILFGAYQFAPTFLGKASTALQFILVLLILFDQAVFPIADIITQICIWLVCIVSSVSGIDYVITWSRKAMTAAKQV